MERVNSEQIIWRYISIEKLIDLLLNKRLIFPPISSMSDQNEVSWILSTITPETEKYRKGLQHHVDTLRANNFISCWTKNSNEKISLWRHYLGKEFMGVAIKSTVGNLYDKINWGDKYSFSIEEVKYYKSLKFSDAESDIIIYSKSIAYKDEEEIRVFAKPSSNSIKDGRIKRDEPPKYLSIDVDVDNFIEEIIISPSLFGLAKRNY